MCSPRLQKKNNISHLYHFALLFQEVFQADLYILISEILLITNEHFPPLGLLALGLELVWIYGWKSILFLPFNSS